MFSLVSSKFLAMRNITLYSVHTSYRFISAFWQKFMKCHVHSNRILLKRRSQPIVSCKVLQGQVPLQKWLTLVYAYLVCMYVWKVLRWFYKENKFGNWKAGNLFFLGNKTGFLRMHNNGTKSSSCTDYMSP